MYTIVIDMQQRVKKKQRSAIRLKIVVQTDVIDFGMYYEKDFLNDI